MRLMRQHGIPEATARVLVSVGEALRQAAQQAQLEHAASFDIDMGAPAGPLRAGSAHEVDVADQIAAMRPGHRYVAVHTHATSAGFSDRDVALLLSNEPIRTIVAIGFDGTWHALSKQPNRKHATREAAVRAFQLALQRLAAPYLARARAGTMSPDQALQEAVHEIWQLLAPPLGLRYDRSR